MLKSKRRLFSLLVFLFSAGSALAVVKYTDPDSARLYQFALLYLAILLAVYFFVLFAVPRALAPAALIALLAVVALVLQSQGMLTLLAGLLLLGIFILIELYVTSR